MKYLLWGTGKGAKKFMEFYVKNKFSNFFRVNEIVSFVDNNIEKKGSCFYGKKIISPDEISKQVYDKIWILSAYKSEIEDQLINQLGIDKAKILGREDVFDEIYSYYENVCHLSQKRILLIGENIDEKRTMYNGFDIIGKLNINSLDEIFNYSYDFVWLTYTLNCSEPKKLWEIRNIKRLISEYHVPEEKIVDDSIFDVFNGVFKQVSYGGENPEKHFLVIRIEFEMGLVGIIYYTGKAVRYAQEHGYIPVVDLETYKNQYHDKGEVGKVNVWEKFFEQPAGMSVEDICRSKNIILFPRTGPIAISDEIPKWQPVMKPQIQVAIEEYYDKNAMKNKKVLGVIFRGTDYVNMKPYNHSIQPTLEEMISMVKRKLKEWSDGEEYDAIFLCTEVEEADVRFKEEFGDMLLSYPQERIPANWNKYNALYQWKDSGYKRGADYLAAMVILSRCESLVGGECGAAQYAIELNQNQYTHQYVFDLGRYGC